LKKVGYTAFYSSANYDLMMEIVETLLR